MVLCMELPAAQMVDRDDATVAQATALGHTVASIPLGTISRDFSLMVNNTAYGFCGVELSHQMVCWDSSIAEKLSKKDKLLGNP